MTSEAGTRATTIQGAFATAAVVTAARPRASCTRPEWQSLQSRDMPLPSETRCRTPEQAVVVDGRPGSVVATTRPARSTISADPSELWRR